MVCFCVSSYGNEKLVRNLIKSAAAVGLPVVVFALDSEMANAIKDECEVVMYHSDMDVESSKFYRFGSKSFKNVIYQRFLIGDKMLRCGKTIVYLDTDIVVRTDFRDDISKLHESPSDAVFQFNGRHANSGFYSIKPTDRSVGLFTQEFLDENEYLTYDRNQVFLQQRVVGKKLLKVDFLNRDEYPNGKWYYQNSSRIDSICKIIHFNHVVGEDGKIDKMKKYGYWFI